jgi:hypothetical protein
MFFALITIWQTVFAHPQSYWQFSGLLANKDGATFKNLLVLATARY